MEPISVRVRAMYETFSYPSRTADDLFDSHPRLCLSYRSGNRQARTLSILDAGCGTGAYSLGTALFNRDCQVTAADFNREALGKIRREMQALDLSNLRVTETDLNTLMGLDVPPRGFDFILCGGVIHHLANPAKGLGNLAAALAPEGVMRLMVYNTLGRQALARYVNALHLIQTQSDRPEQRLRLARSLLSSLTAGPLRQAPWGDGGDVDDVEFVDRYLHPHEVTYSVAEYLELLDGVGLTFLRWHEPLLWDLSCYVNDPEVLAELLCLPQPVQYQLVEHLSNQVMLDGYVAHKGSRLACYSELCEGLMVALNPQVVLQVCQQTQGGLSSEIAPRAFLRGRPSVPLETSGYQLLRRLTQGPVLAQTLVATPEEESCLIHLIKSELAYAYLPC